MAKEQQSSFHSLSFEPKSRNLSSGRTQELTKNLTLLTSLFKYFPRPFLRQKPENRNLVYPGTYKPHWHSRPSLWKDQRRQRWQEKPGW